MILTNKNLTLLFHSPSTNSARSEPGVDTPLPDQMSPSIIEQLSSIALWLQKCGIDSNHSLLYQKTRSMVIVDSLKRLGLAIFATYIVILLGFSDLRRVFSDLSMCLAIFVTYTVILLGFSDLCDVYCDLRLGFSDLYMCLAILAWV